MNEDKNYNDEKESIDFIEVLKKHNWKKSYEKENEIHFIRPGKQNGTSAVFYENKKKKALIKSKFEINKKTCRICLEEDEEKTSLINPIVAACLCKGSSGDIHVKCL